MAPSAEIVAWVVGVVVALTLAWLALRFLIPLLLPVMLGPQRGTVAACRLKLFLGAFLGSKGLTATRQGNGRQVAAGQLTLAGELWKQYPRMSQKDFENYTVYLERADDSGREPVSAWAKVVLFALTATEMASMSFAIALVLSRGELSLTGSYALAVAAALIGGWAFSKLAIPAGESLYRRNKYSFARRGVSTDPERSGRYLAAPSGVINYTDTQSDDDKPRWHQLLSRMGHVRTTAFWSFILLVVVVFFVLIAFRFGDFIGTASQDVSAGEAIPLAQWLSNSSIVLFIAILFVVTQAWGIYLGHAHGFAGTDSLQAKTAMCFKSSWSQFLDFQAGYLASCDALLREWKLKAGDNVNPEICVSGMAEVYSEAERK